MTGKLNRYRFYVPENEAGDTRPVKWPPPGPAWQTGYGHDYHVWVAYAPNEEVLLEYWPDAYAVDEHAIGVEPCFTDRFPKPEWWQGDGVTST